MESNVWSGKMKKRPHEGIEGDEMKKKSLARPRIHNGEDNHVSGGSGLSKIYKFRVLLPNGSTLDVEIPDPVDVMPLKEFVEFVKKEYFQSIKRTGNPKQIRTVNWKSQGLCFLDDYDRKIKKSLVFKNFTPRKWYILRLDDGCGEADSYENMWDLTPDTKLLKELPEEYTFETALSDLIDNSLQAVWSNGQNNMKLISLEISDDRISIFDNGPGMDGSEENSIVNWGRMGASLHRSLRGKAIGIRPPYLMPCFGMFGYGGPIASMHLGRRTLVSSKTKASKKVYTLHLERDALLRSSGSEKTWRTKGGLRDPSENELQNSANGSFTKVEIFNLKMRDVGILQLQSKLKDIYFPYIQSDEVSSTGRTIMPVKFQVNGSDLAEIEGGEVAITNLNSCNGPEFVFQLRFSFSDSVDRLGSRGYQEANARLKCVYFPIVEGEESIEKILKTIKEEGCRITETYDSFSRVSIRRLGRLLPDARWQRLPFMEPKHWRSDKAHILKRCYLRVKCFIDADAGFNPTPSKTDLAHHHPFTTALRNFGCKSSEKDKGSVEMHIEFYKDGKPLTFSQLENLYKAWIFQMHNQYDVELDIGDDQPVVVVSPSNKEALGISSEVVRVHKVIQRKGISWRSGQKIKVLKGACTGFYRTNMYATLEYILLEGFQGDFGGEARLICRPLDKPDESGCLLEMDNENVSIDIRNSISLPISVIDSGKCQAIGTNDWKLQLEKQHQKTPASIDILSAEQCQVLRIDGVFTFDDTVKAGRDPPKKIVAVIRPSSFSSTSASNNLEPKYINREHFEMSLQINFIPEGLQDAHHIYSRRVTPSSCGGIHGVYLFSLPCNLAQLFEKAGVYRFLFSLKELKSVNCEKRVKVLPLSEVIRWQLLSDVKGEKCRIRLGSFFPTFSIAFCDMYDNWIPFSSVPKVTVQFSSDNIVLSHRKKMKVHKSHPFHLIVKELLIETNELDKIQPTYEVTLLICSEDKKFSVAIPCQVVPGPLTSVTAQPLNFAKQLLPGHVIKELVLQMFDAYGNHVEKNAEILLNVDGFSFRDKAGLKRKVDERGCVDLSGLLQVTKGFGKKVSLSVLSDGNVIFKKEFQTEKRELRMASKVPEYCVAGSQLETIMVEVVNSKGDLDETIHDDEKHQSHSLTLKSELLDTECGRYRFRKGRCLVDSITLPKIEGRFSFVASHSHYPELHLIIEVYVQKHPVSGDFQSRLLDGQNVLLEDQLVFKTPKLEADDVQQQYLDREVLAFPNSSTPKNVEALVYSICKDHKELEEKVIKYGLCLGQHENNLEVLNSQLVAVKQKMAKLQASVDLDLCESSYCSPEKDIMMESIETKGNSAASIVCKAFKAISLEKEHNHQFAELIVGVVALLGAVQTIELSRVLAKFLGEDQMLALVCKSHTVVKALEKYDKTGNVSQSYGLHALAAEFGRSIGGHYLVICLEDVRPYRGELRNDLQRTLVLPHPTAEDKNIPEGYLGHAVNMLHLDGESLHIRTSAGNGLRETLLYCLFGELQVYENRKCMIRAKSYITQGAVSLDGGIMRRNGIISLGHWEPDIRFPVITAEYLTQLSPSRMAILSQIEENKLKLQETVCKIESETKSLEKTRKKFSKKKGKYIKFVDEKEPLIKALKFETSMNCSSNSSL